MAARFGEGNVFMDVDLAPGVDFVERITEVVAACHVLIVVMGPHWATVKDEDGRARLADPEDFVRLEVESALRRPEVTPIPVLVAGAKMPDRDELPQEIRAITRRNALELSDLRWRQDVGRLMSTLDELLAETRPVTDPPSPERGVATSKAAPAEPARAASEAAPPSTGEATASVATKPAAPPARGRRGLRWALLGAVGLAAIVVAVVVAVGGGGSPAPTTHFSRADLPHVVLPGEDEPGNLLFRSDQSGPDVTTDNLPSKNQPSYLNVFAYKNRRDEPYWYSESAAAVFEDADAAQGALDILRGIIRARTSKPYRPRALATTAWRSWSQARRDRNTVTPGEPATSCRSLTSNGAHRPRTRTLLATSLTRSIR